MLSVAMAQSFIWVLLHIGMPFFHDLNNRNHD